MFMSCKMENFQGLLFPTSSSSTSLSLNLTNSLGNYGEFAGDQKDNGILGLMGDHMEVPDHTLNNIIAAKNYKDHVPENNSLSLVATTSTTTESEVIKIDKTMKKKKKGENKKMRKARYAFQTRSHVDILDDGYRWRKYGQKAVKNNKFPRSYYRCTHQGCNVKKQVQRLSKDEGIVETTYEGMHSHPIQKTNDNFEHILSQMQIYNTTSSF